MSGSVVEVKALWSVSWRRSDRSFREVDCGENEAKARKLYARVHGFLQGRKLTEPSMFTGAALQQTPADVRYWQRLPEVVAACNRSYEPPYGEQLPVWRRKAKP